jgi:hypothetical protein
LAKASMPSVAKRPGSSAEMAATGDAWFYAFEPR